MNCLSYSGFTAAAAVIELDALIRKHIQDNTRHFVQHRCFDEVAGYNLSGSCLRVLHNVRFNIKGKYITLFFPFHTDVTSGLYLA